MATLDETTANKAIKEALQALQRARELSERAGYGSLVVGPLEDAQLWTNNKVGHKTIKYDTKQ